MYESTLGRPDQAPVLDSDRQLPNKILVESAWIEPMEPKPPDKTVQTDNTDVKPSDVPDVDARTLRTLNVLVSRIVTTFE